MSSSARDRVCDLLADRATVGLNDAERDELKSLIDRNPELAELDDDSLDLAAAAVCTALQTDETPLSPSTRQRVEANAEAWFHPASRPRGNAMASLGWFAAAACLMLAAFGWLRDPGSNPAPAETSAPTAAQAKPGPAERLARLRGLPPSVNLAWQATEDPTAVSASGDVVWNNDRQEGYMRFSGLAANDPTEFQYQLWIFDSARNTDYPIDGGVFDVPAGKDEWVVPIQARLPVTEAVLFAVTVEPPGGVVVSSRERIALTAQPQG